MHSVIDCVLLNSSLEFFHGARGVSDVSEKLRVIAMPRSRFWSILKTLISFLVLYKGAGGRYASEGCFGSSGEETQSVLQSGHLTLCFIFKKHSSKHF